MRRVLFVLAVALGSSLLAAQTPQTPPQSARQALIEMFLSKGENDFTRHLPEVASKALLHKGETAESSVVLKISTIGRSIVAQGHVETFDAGPNILVIEQPEKHERIEVAVEHDSLMGEADEIELSVHYYKDGQEETLPIIPRLIFTMKQEKDIWRLTELTASGHIPLTDPDYLKTLRKEQDQANERMVQWRMNMIVGIEKTYATAHPQVGYTCTLSALIPQKTESGEPGTDGSFDPGQGNEEWSGYRFALAGCSGAPSSKYRLTAVPLDPESEAKIYCADETGKIKSLAKGKPFACFSSGQDVFAVPQYSSEE